MDDPFVALSLWQSQENSKSENYFDEDVEKPDHKSSCTKSHRGEDRSLDKKSTGNCKSNSPSSGNCFPCLSGLELDSTQANRRTEKGISPPVNLVSNGIDSRTHDPVAEDMRDCSDILGASPLPQLDSFLLLRLFESNLFTMDIALQYLFTEKETTVREYLGKKLFMFESEEVNFYLLQLVSMFIHVGDLCAILHKYFLRRCQHDIMFSLKLSWLLNSNTQDKWLPQAELQRASRMSHSIQNEQIRPSQSAIVPQNESNPRHSVCQLVLEKQFFEKTHQRSYSANGVNLMSESLPHFNTIDGRNDPPGSNGSRRALGDLRSGRAFETGCDCILATAHVLAGSNTPVCSCSAPRLGAQDFFIHHLGTISKKLLKYSNNSLRTSHLYAELSQVNLNLPARLCLPLYLKPHQVVRICGSEAVVLNSKSKAPYIVFVEVLECDHTYLSPLPNKQLESYVKGFGLSPEEAKHYIHSEGPSPSTTRASSMPSLKCYDSYSLNSIDVPHFSDVAEEIEEEIAGDEDKCSYSSKGDSSCSPTETSREHDEDEDIELVTFSVGDIRRRLSRDSVGPRKMFTRDPTDPSAAALKEPWETKVERIRKGSPYGHLPHWKLVGAIVKWGDDLRQEMMCWQLLVLFERVWKEENVPLWIRPYMVLVVSSEGGLIEPVCNAVSLHQIKKQFKGSLRDYFQHEYGERNSETFLTAQKNFVESCAAYCLVCYFIQVKDRHNGNILLDSAGHIIHIDFGFILANSPGNNIRFESSPFKLTEEFVEVMGGIDSDMYRYFKFLMLKGFLAARKHMDRFINIVNITQTGSQLPCFGHGPTTILQLRERFCMSLTEEQLEKFINGMVENSMNSLTTKLYDGFQYLANGIL